MRPTIEAKLALTARIDVLHPFLDNDAIRFARVNHLWQG